MERIGYIAYFILVFIAFTWVLGVRLKFGTGLHTIIGSLFFTLSAIIFLKLHCYVVTKFPPNSAL